MADGASRPNIAFLVVESTDGRTWSPGYQDDVIPLPNLRKLQAGGTRFERHYANTPVCCPSRAALWSGRAARAQPPARVGALGRHRRRRRVEQLRRAAGELLGPDRPAARARRRRRLEDDDGDGAYDIFVNGKADWWTTGAHSENAYLNAWTM